MRYLPIEAIESGVREELLSSAASSVVLAFRENEEFKPELGGLVGLESEAERESTTVDTLLRLEDEKTDSVVEEVKVPVMD